MPTPRQRLKANGARWERVRRAAKERDGWRCVKCGLAGPKLEVHHLVELHKGGAPYDLLNVATYCYRCHRVAHGYSESEKKSRWKALVKHTLATYHLPRGK